jgi:hypothetical protein
MHKTLVFASALVMVAATLLTTPCFPTGSIVGHALDINKNGLYELEITQCKAGESKNAQWARFAVDGYYELKDLSPGVYSLLQNDIFYFRPRLFSFIPVRDGQITDGNYTVRSTYFVNKNDDGPQCFEYRQTFVATGDVVKVTVWPRGEGVILLGSIHEADTGKQIGPTRESGIDSRDTFNWLHGECPTVPGKLYYLKLIRKDGGKFSLYVDSSSGGKAYPDGQAFYDGVPQPNTDIKCCIESDDDGLATMVYRVKNEGGRSGKELGQTFKAIGSNITAITVFCTAIEGQYAEARFSIHEGGPGGKQIGPAKTCRVWNYRPMGQIFGVSWLPGEVPVTPGKTYYLKVTSSGIYAFINTSNRYQDGQFYVDGKAIDPNEDWSMTVMGEIYPFSSVASLKGTVKDMYGQPIANASIKLTPWSYSTTSDDKGEFRLSKVTSGEYDVECLAPGYGSSIRHITLKPGKEHELNFVMSKVAPN